MVRIAAFFIALVFSGWGGASAKPAYEDPRTPEGWAWSKIRSDQIADFNERCRKELDAREKDGWDDPCRQISAQFVVNALTNPKLRDQVPRHGVRLSGARIIGGFDVADAEVKPEVRIEVSRIEGDATLDD